MRNLQNRARRKTWSSGIVGECIRSAEIRDKRAWAEYTFPGAQLGRKKQPNAESRREIQRLKNIFPVKVLKQKVEECELRDYRVKAEKLTPKGEYYGMKNFSRSISVANYFRKVWKHSYPEKTEIPSLHKLVLALDSTLDDDVFEDCGLISSRSEPGRRRKSDSDLCAVRWMDDSSVQTSKSFKPASRPSYNMLVGEGSK